MWIKSLDNLRKLVPEDGAWHDLNIIGNRVYVDGTEVATSEMFPGVIGEMVVVDHVLSGSEMAEFQAREGSDEHSR